MRKTTFAAIVLAAAFAAPQSAVAADQDFTLKNATGYDIREVYVSVPAAKTWGKDIMGDGILSDGSAKAVHFHPETESCSWDMQVVFTDNERVEWGGIDLCSIQKITLHYKNGQASATAE